MWAPLKSKPRSSPSACAAASLVAAVIIVVVVILSAADSRWSPGRRVATAVEIAVAAALTTHLSYAKRMTNEQACPAIVAPRFRLANGPGSCGHFEPAATTWCKVIKAVSGGGGLYY